LSLTFPDPPPPPHPTPSAPPRSLSLADHQALSTRSEGELKLEEAHRREVEFWNSRIAQVDRFLKSVASKAT
jgi:hypothetical protein